MEEIEEYEVSLKRLGTAGYIDTSVWQRDNGQTIAYRAEVEGMEFSGEDEDNFTAFKKLRDDLLKGGYGMCCAGAMTNAVQSGMLAGSDRVYLVMKGRKPALTDAVWIFMETAMTEFPDSMAQDRFAEEWFGSI